ncbi:hypothetical protein BH23PLA1_BH23PLA1_31410 [soil metagenome]
MAFRMILVGVVASLGFDLPTGRDVEDWASTGRAWFDARVSEFQARQEIVEGAPAPEVIALAGTVEDRTFAAVVEEMVSAFVVNGQTMAPLSEEAVPVAGEISAFGNELADALNHGADGLSEPVEPAPVAVEATGFEIVSLDLEGMGSILEADDASDLVEGETELPRATTDTSDSSEAVAVAPAMVEEPGSPDDRVAEAVRLTGQALQAWMTLLQSGIASAPLSE